MVYEHVDAYHMEKVELNVKYLSSNSKMWIKKVYWLQYKITLTVLISKSYRRKEWLW
jgi:hypothetical protein